MAEKPKVLKGYLQKRGPTALSGWNRRWFVLAENKLTYYKEKEDTASVASIDLGNLQQLSKNPDNAPKGLHDSAFSLDVREQKDVTTYFLAANSVAEKDAWINGIMASRKYYTALQKGQIAQPQQQHAAADVAGLQKELEAAKEKIAELERECGKLHEELMEVQERAGAGGGGGGGGGGDEELQKEIAMLKEQLEEEQAISADFKKKYLELRAEHKNRPN